jgi:ATP-dependent Clp protease, protease subunit
MEMLELLGPEVMLEDDPMWASKRHLLMDDIHSGSVERALRFLYKYDTVPREEKDILEIIVNSSGGHLHSAFALLDKMESHKFPIATYATGMAASCGLLISMTGAKGKRKVHKNTSILSHQFSAGSSGTFADLEAESVLFDQINENIMKHYMKHTKKSRKYIEKHLLKPNNVWLTAEEAVKHGLFDEVVG